MNGLTTAALLASVSLFVAPRLLPQETAQEPTSSVRRSGTTQASEYIRSPVVGFDVRLAPGLTASGDFADVGARALSALALDLGDLLDQLPAKRHAHLQSVPIYVGVADPVAVCACYHPSATWLERNGFDPKKARAVEIANAGTYLEWRRRQPSMLLHELAHAYHDQVLGKSHAGVRAALATARAKGRYDRTLRWMGQVDRHYALTSADEYFAETTEALFGVNDFFPFVRAELMNHDPDGAALVASLWGAPAPPQHGLRMQDAPTLAGDEIARLHVFFEEWFRGSVSNDEKSFARFESALAPDFEMVTPKGQVVERGALLERLRSAHGARQVAIETRLVSARQLAPTRIHATYEERQTEDEKNTTIVSSVLFEVEPRAPGGLVWVHLHETLLDSQ